VFGDANCGVNALALAQTGTVINASSQLAFNMNLTVPDGYFTLGMVLFTSGANEGVSRSIKFSSASGNGVMLTAPLPAEPAIGDAFTITPGCALSVAACQNWDAVAHPALTYVQRFRGTPFVPPPTTGLPS
jgi:hypothetical protein